METPCPRVSFLFQESGEMEVVCDFKQYLQQFNPYFVYGNDLLTFLLLAVGLHEVKRQLIPFPRVGKRIPMIPMQMYMDPFYAEYESQYVPWYDPMAVDGLTSGVASAFTADKDDGNIDVDKKSSPTPNANGGMWFGPRLGKRKKRSIESSESSIEHSRDSLDTRTLVKILHNFNWAIVPIKGNFYYTNI